MKSLPAVIIAMVVVAAAGCAGGGGSVSMEPTVDVTGKWVGHWVGTITSGTVVSAQAGPVEMTLTQTGSQATGDLRMPGSPFDPSGPIQVTISGNTAHIIQPSKLTGTLTVQGDIMSGRVIGGSIKGDVTLQRQK
jgi:hypothetical protein